MNIVSLRNVSAFEIPDSFKGILRISPMKNKNDELCDDITSLLKGELYDSTTPIRLSNSEGTILPLEFKPWICRTKVYGESNTVKLHALSHVFKAGLFVVDNLKIKSTLYLETLKFIKDKNVLIYPKDSPFASTYFNKENRFNFDRNISVEENLRTNYDNLLTNGVYNINDDTYKTEHIKLGNDYVYRYEYITDGVNSGTKKVNQLNYRDYVVGVAPGNVYKENDLINTQLSFLNLDDLIWKTIEAYNKGVYRNATGRYIFSSEKSKLFKELFGENVSVEEIEKKAPLVGLPIQPGTIHYNAIPARRYFFHYKRYNDNVKKPVRISGNVTSNIIKEFVLCDGKELPESIIDSNITKTPPLFECDQLSPRYIRGLNWLRTNSKGEILDNDVLNDKGGSGEEIASFINNNKIYKKVSNNTDAANHKKDLHDVGTYFVNYDSKLRTKYKHAHLLFTEDSGEISSYDTLSNVKETFFGGNTENTPGGKTYEDSWKNYINFKENTFLGSYMMRTVGGLATDEIDDERLVRDCPISCAGGSTNNFFYRQSCYQPGRKRKLTGCKHYGYVCRNMNIKDSRYELQHSLGAEKPMQNNSLSQWRFFTSLPVVNKYGSQEEIPGNNTTLSSAVYGETSYYIDDSLAFPPSNNFIPLMKI